MKALAEVGAYSSKDELAVFLSRPNNALLICRYKFMTMPQILGHPVSAQATSLGNRNACETEQRILRDLGATDSIVFPYGVREETPDMCFRLPGGGVKVQTQHVKYAEK